MNTFINLNDLSDIQVIQYRNAIAKAFPRVIGESQHIKNYWDRLEKYFPKYQQFLIDDADDIIGFMNTVPFHFNDKLSDLPMDGWDWMLAKGISDYDNKIRPLYLGGLQVIVRTEYQGKGYSKEIIKHAKKVIQSYHLQNLVIPIRPTQKHLFPRMPMHMYMKKKKENKIYDPWIRTHVNGGAEIIKVCEHSMLVEGDVPFWELLLGSKVQKSGDYILEGALSPIHIDVENNKGKYVEPNIWIKYS